jgi:hypothetical protein
MMLRHKSFAAAIAACFVFVASIFAYDSEWPPAPDPQTSSIPPAPGLEMGRLEIDVPSVFAEWLNHQHIDGWGSEPFSITVGDVDGADDGDFCVVISVAHEAIMAARVDVDWAANTGTLTPLWAWKTPTCPATAPAAPHNGPHQRNCIVWDFNNDGTNEVVVTCQALSGKNVTYLLGQDANPPAPPWDFAGVPPAKVLAVSGEEASDGNFSEMGGRIGLCRVRNTPYAQDIICHNHDGNTFGIYSVTENGGVWAIDKIFHRIYSYPSNRPYRCHEFNYLDVDGDGFDEFTHDGLVDFVDADGGGNAVPTNPSRPMAGIQVWRTGHDIYDDYKHTDQMAGADWDPSRPGFEILSVPETDWVDNYSSAPRLGVTCLFDALTGEVIREDRDSDFRHPQSITAGNFAGDRAGLEVIHHPKSFNYTLAGGGEAFQASGHALDINFNELAVDGAYWIAQDTKKSADNKFPTARSSGPGGMGHWAMDWDGDYAADEILNSCWNAAIVWRMGTKGDWGATPPPGMPTWAQLQNSWIESYPPEGLNATMWWPYYQGAWGNRIGPSPDSGLKDGWGMNNGGAGRGTHYYEKLGEVYGGGLYALAAYDVSRDYREEVVHLRGKGGTKASLSIHYNSDILVTAGATRRSPAESRLYRQKKQEVIPDPFVYLNLPSFTDTDNDGLSDDDEDNVYYTQKYVFDSDGDLLSDAEEVLIYKTQPNKADTDGDGVPDGEEVENRTNPLRHDGLIIMDVDFDSSSYSNGAAPGADASHDPNFNWTYAGAHLADSVYADDSGMDGTRSVTLNDASGRSNANFTEDRLSAYAEGAGVAVGRLTYDFMVKDMKGSDFRIWTFLRNSSGFAQNNISSLYTNVRQQVVADGTMVFNLYSSPDNTSAAQLAGLRINKVYRVTVEWDFKSATDIISLVSVIEDPAGAGIDLVAAQLGGRVEVNITGAPRNNPDVGGIVGVAFGTNVTVEAQIDNIKVFDLNPPPLAGGGFDWGSLSGSGTFSQGIAQDETVTVGEIPAGLCGVEIYLTCDEDVDIQLFDKETGAIVVGWPEGLAQPGKCYTTYNGVRITYSGWNGDGTNYGHEYIRLADTTTRPLVMKAWGYRAGAATVDYSWTGSANGGSGTFSQAVATDETVEVGSIPRGRSGVEIYLTCDEDVDIQLFDKATGAMVIGWPGGFAQPGLGTTTYNGVDIEYSGWNGDGTHYGHEFIKILDPTNRDFTMKAWGYRAGDATVDYLWAGSKTGGIGTFAQAIATDEVAEVGPIPAGLGGVEIYLTCDEDVDIQLFDKETGATVVGWPGGFAQPGPGTTTYNGVDIEYSGWNGDGTNYGHEFIKILDPTNRAFTMKAWGYRAGNATVDYQWATDGGGVALEASTDVVIGEIPLQARDVELILESDNAVDIQLFDKETAARIVGLPDGLLKTAGMGSIDYNGMTIQYSGTGGDGTGPGHESITIAGPVTRELVMKAYGNRSGGTAPVRYSWTVGD